MLKNQPRSNFAPQASVPSTTTWSSTGKGMGDAPGVTTRAKCTSREIPLRNKFVLTGPKSNENRNSHLLEMSTAATGVHCRCRVFQVKS
jgi:hypothetical protein